MEVFTVIYVPLEQAHTDNVRNIFFLNFAKNYAEHLNLHDLYYLLIRPQFIATRHWMLA